MPPSTLNLRQTVAATAVETTPSQSILSVLKLVRSSDATVPPSQNLARGGISPPYVSNYGRGELKARDRFYGVWPSVAKVSLALNSRKLPMNAERFLEPGFIAPGAQKAWCNIQNSSLSEPAPKPYACLLDFAFLALLYSVENANHPWAAVHKRMPAMPQIFSLGNFVPGTKISIRAVGLGRLVPHEENEKADISLALWERRHWLQQSAMENAILAFRKACDPQDPFLFFVLELWSELNRTRNLRADRLRLQIARLWDWCTSDDGPPEHPTEILLELSHQQYSIETLDWSRELRVLDAKQPWRNCWVDAPAEYPYNTLFAPCNPEIPLFVPTAWTHKAIASQVVVDPSLSEAEIQAPWVRDDSVVDEADPEESVGSGDTPAEASATVTSEESKSEEVCEALNEASFPFSRGSASTTAGSSVVSPSPATVVPAAEDPPEEIVLAPFELLVQIATRQPPASD
ncbi:hypothetical protein PHMEG_00031333 [Phytophthora megakarya]|uniref:Uncharacterized protein n=1 Tax=Phytophthora megakarya TaxID=4795 RepID=A0A225UY06_9STRA|nr:hypothetical protein PHMEG_00031333 [Phytophthora megakarya]